MIYELSEDSFTWSRWRSFNLFSELKIPTKETFILKKKRIILQYAVGYIEAHKLRCRPKLNHKAVMFCYNGYLSWCHLTDEEFNGVFKGQVIGYGEKR